MILDCVTWCYKRVNELLLLLNLIGVDTLHQADTSKGPKGVCLKQISLYKQTKNDNSTCVYFPYGSQKIYDIGIQTTKAVVISNQNNYTEDNLAARTI